MSIRYKGQRPTLVTIEAGFTMRGANTDPNNPPPEPKKYGGPELHRDPKYPTLLQNGMTRGSGGGGNEPPSGGGGSGSGPSGRPHPDRFIPGRMSSKFDDKSAGNVPFEDVGSRENEERQWNIARETWGTGDHRFEAKAGTKGYTYTYGRPRDDGGASKVKTSYITGHQSGHLHIHPDKRDGSQDYFAEAERWIGKKTILSYIIDKGRKPK